MDHGNRVDDRNKDKTRLLLGISLAAGTAFLAFRRLLFGQALLLGSLLSGNSLGAIVLADGLQNGLLLLGLDDGDGVGEGLLRTGLALGVGAAHDLNLDTKDTLAEENVTGSGVDELLSGVTGVDHESVLGSKISDQFRATRNQWRIAVAEFTPHAYTQGVPFKDI